MKLSDKCIYYVIINKDKFKDYKNIKDETEMAHLLLEKVMTLFNLKIKNITYTEYGKPYFRNSNIYFNYSHSNNYIALGFATTDIGVDIEERIVTDLVSDKYLDSARGKNKLKNWVLKEAYSKLDGRGLSMFKEIDLNKMCCNYKLLRHRDYMCAIMYKGSKRKLVNIYGGLNEREDKFK